MNVDVLLANKVLVGALLVMWGIGMVLKHRVAPFDHKTWMWAIQLLVGQVAAFAAAGPDGFDWNAALEGFGLSVTALGGHGLAKGIVKAAASALKVT